MKIDLLKTYDDMIQNDKTTQQGIDKYYNAIYLDSFIRPDLRINQRAGHKSNGEFIEGMHVYPDRECISEILKQVQDRINSDETLISKLRSNKLGALLFISDLVNSYITNYFGGTENTNKSDSVFHDGTNDPLERMANLSDFKNKNCAVCIERALATYIVLCVIANNSDMKEAFPFKPYFSVINYCPNITEKSGAEEHALCGLISCDNKNEIYLLDPSNYGLVEDETGRKQYVHGLYELSEEEIDLMFGGDAIEPTLFRCKHFNGLTQLSHRALSKKASGFDELKRKNSGTHK